MSRIPENAKLVINHISFQRPYFKPQISEESKSEEDYVCVFTLESEEENLGFIYIQHFPASAQGKDKAVLKKWLYENMTSASFIKSHPLK